MWSCKVTKKDFRMRNKDHIWREMWQSVQSVTNYKPSDRAVDDVALLTTYFLTFILWQHEVKHVLIYVISICLTSSTTHPKTKSPKCLVCFSQHSVKEKGIS